MPDTNTSPLTVAVMTAFLRTGKGVDYASSVLLLGSVFLYALQVAPPLLVLAAALALLLALAEKYYAWRVALDAEFFALLCQSPNQTTAFDEALATALGRDAITPPRSMQSRWRGAKRLLCYQAATCGLQALVLAALIVIKASPA